jgi:hypothetical protein
MHIGRAEAAMRGVLIVEADRKQRECLGGAVAFAGHRPIAVASAREAEIVLELEPVGCVILSGADDREDVRALLHSLREGPLSAVPRILLTPKRCDILDREQRILPDDRRGLLAAIDAFLGRGGALSRVPVNAYH